MGAAGYAPSGNKSVYLLEACRSWPLSPELLTQLQGMPEWGQARDWGWIMRTGELTGMGAGHAGPIPKGLAPD